MKKILKFVNKTVFKRDKAFLFFFIIVCLFSRLNLDFFLIDILGQLGFQIIVIGILLFFILLIYKKFWMSMSCILICLLLTIDILLSCSQCNAFLEDKSLSYNKIRLITFNTNSNIQLKNFDNLLELILFEKPDIVHLQEVSQRMEDKIKSLQSSFPYSIGLNKPRGHYDSIILSRHPLINNKLNDIHSIITSLKLNESELNIIAVHLFLGTQTDFNMAKKQMNYVKTLISDTNKNFILMGDLNMTPSSKRFTNFLKEANLYTYISYKQPTFTWPTFLPDFFGIQIDHVLFSKNFKLINKKTVNNLGSDHRLLIVDLAYGDGQNTN